MARKLIDIQKKIDSEAAPFRIYLEKVLDKEVIHFINRLCKVCTVYIFSGVIRNYFLNIDKIRDIDIVVDGNVDIEHFLESYNYRKNSFGGFKILINNLNVDLWFLHDTWALNYQKTIDFELVKYLPHTTFFNFSSILFSFNEPKFYYTKYFTRFLRDKKIDLVFAPNANDPLCVVNSIYYADKLKLKLGEKLKKHIKKIYKNNIDLYEETQLKHFSKILYSNKTIKERIENI